MSVRHLVELLGGPIQHLPKRPGEPDCTFADVSKIQKMLGWRARVPFETGVRLMLDNIQLWKDAPVWKPAIDRNGNRGMVRPSVAIDHSTIRIDKAMADSPKQKGS